MVGQINTAGRGPLGVPTNSPISDPGTSALIQNKPNVPIGAATAPLHADTGSTGSTARIGGNRLQRTAQLPQLQIGTRGQYVQRLQRLLNSRLDSDTALKVDGMFGPKTRAAVIEFQKDSDMRPDGIVGPKTWFTLITAEQKDSSSEPKPSSAPAPAAPSSGTGIATTGPGPEPGSAPETAPRGAAAPATEKSVDEWSLSERFEYVLLHTGSHLTGNIRTQFAALLTPTGLKFIVGSLVVWGACQFIGIGEVLDAVLLLWAGFSAGRCLGAFVVLTCTASTKAELEDAANDLAQAVEILGVIAFFALLSRVARFLGNKVNAAEEGGAPAGEEAAPASAEAKPPKPEAAPDKSAEGSQKVAPAPTPAEQAAGTQGSGAYPGVDAWKNTVIKKGTVVYQGSPAGASKFFVDGDAVSNAAGNSKALAESTQVAPHPVKGYRPGVTAYVATEDIPAATSEALANPQHGAGGATQFYVPDTGSLKPVSTTPLTH